MRDCSRPAIETLLLKVASRCNIDCSYCYVYQSPDQGWRNQPALLSDRSAERFVARTEELQQSQGREVAVVLHGGEPLLLGASRLGKLLQTLRSRLGPSSTIALQTNGTLLNAEILDVFAETHTRVGVSIDGPAKINDRFRLDHQGKGTFDRVKGGIDLILAHPDCSKFFRGTLSVVDPTSNPAQIYEFLKSLGVPSMDFLYRDGNHDAVPLGKMAVDSVEYGDWMARLWEHYLADPNPIPIEGLDNLFRSLCGNESHSEGTGLVEFGILVVETDGSITKNDTLKSSFDRADRFAAPWSIHSHSFQEVASSAEFQAYVDLQRPTAEPCQTCQVASACGGGMILHRWSSSNQFNNPSVYCHDQQHLILRMLKAIEAAR